MMTGWDPLAGTPSPVFEEARTLLGGDTRGVDNPQCAFEVGLFFFPPQRMERRDPGTNAIIAVTPRSVLQVADVCKPEESEPNGYLTGGPALGPLPRARWTAVRFGIWGSGIVFWGFRSAGRYRNSSKLPSCSMKNGGVLLVTIEWRLRKPAQQVELRLIPGLGQEKLRGCRRGDTPDEALCTFLCFELLYIYHPQIWCTFTVQEAEGNSDGAQTRGIVRTVCGLSLLPNHQDRIPSPNAASTTFIISTTLSPSHIPRSRTGRESNTGEHGRWLPRTFRVNLGGSFIRWKKQ